MLVRPRAPRMSAGRRAAWRRHGRAGLALLGIALLLAACGGGGEGPPPPEAEPSGEAQAAQPEPTSAELEARAEQERAAREARRRQQEARQREEAREAMQEEYGAEEAPRSAEEALAGSEPPSLDTLLEEPLPPPAKGAPGAEAEAEAEGELGPVAMMEPGPGMEPAPGARPAVRVAVLHPAEREEAAIRVALMIEDFQRRRLEEALGRPVRIAYISRDEVEDARPHLIRYREGFLKAALQVASVLPAEQAVEPMTAREKQRLRVDLFVYVASEAR